MGLPLCKPCTRCQETGPTDGHVPADDEVCTVCGFNEHDFWDCIMMLIEMKDQPITFDEAMSEYNNLEEEYQDA